MASIEVRHVSARIPTAQISAVRAFNRFYTRKLGVLDQQLLKSPFSLSEARVMYELAHRGEPCGQGDRDRARSRSRLSQPDRPEIRRGRLDHPQGRWPSDRRQYQLGLTAKGRQAFAKLDRSSHDEVAAMLAALLAARPQPPDRGDGHDRTAARPGARPAATGDPARPASGRHGMGGAEPRRALRQRIRFRFLVRSPGRGDRGKIPRLVRRLARTLLDRRTRRRPGRLGLSGQSTATMSPSCGCCWSTRPGADRDWAGGWSPNASRSRAPAAIAGSRCGPRAS